MPGADVSTGLKVPRYSAGASGFMSQVSMCDAPPLSQMRMADFATFRLPVGEGAASARPARFTPKNGSPPASRNVRRESDEDGITSGTSRAVRTAR